MLASRCKCAVAPGGQTSSGKQSSSLKLLNLPANNTMNCNLQRPPLAYITVITYSSRSPCSGNIHEAIPFYWVAIGATTAHRLCLPETAPGLLKGATPGNRGTPPPSPGRCGHRAAGTGQRRAPRPPRLSGYSRRPAAGLSTAAP